jgi:ribosomal protein S18 acetylase RimI-like enzyme
MVRHAQPADDLAPLLYAASPDLYDTYFGGRVRAIAGLARLTRHGGHSAGHDVCLVAARDGIVGVLAGFPETESDVRERRFRVLALRRMPPWRWAGPWRTARIQAGIDAGPPPGAWYVDSLAVAPEHRRIGLGRALMEEAERRARGAGCRLLAVDTAEGNRAARGLYESCGMQVRRRAAVPPATRALGVHLTGWVAYVKAL